MKKGHIITACLLIIALLFSMVPAVPARADEVPSGIPGKMKQVAENDSLILYLDEEETSIAVYVKENGDVWFSNPVDADSDTSASDYQKNPLKAQLFVRYFNENVQEATMDNYSQCIKDGQFEIEPLSDGVKITYTIGEGISKLLLPQVISVERMEQFAAKLESSQSKKLLRNYTKYELATVKESDKKDLLENYPGLENHSIYVLKSSVKDYIKEELSGYIQEAGYTWEDYDFDLTDNGYQTADTKPWFVIPLTYRLEGRNLIAEVDPEEITYNEEGYYPVEVEMLPYFGAAKKGEEGYIFVPDGSGALIYNDTKSNIAYNARVYGQDVTMNVLSTVKSQIDQSVTIKLPVFGMKKGDTAWYAVIEDGDAYADITASTSGRVNNYNNVYAGFQFLEYGVSTLGSMVGSNSFQMYSLREFDGTYKLRFGFLSGENADYSGMACAYRDYLTGKGVLKTRLTEGSAPFYVEYIGAIDKSATFLGIKNRAVTPVTTYAQAEKITDALLTAGVNDINVIWSGWANHGLHGTAHTEIKNVGKLSNGGVSQKKFLSDMAGKGVDTYFTAEYQHVYRDLPADGYTVLGSAPKYFDRSAVKEATYYLSNNMVDSNDKIALIKPTLAVKVTNALKKAFAKQTGVGFSIGTISSNLYTDQQTENYTDRQRALLLNTAAVKDLYDAFGGKIIADNANAYMFGYAADIINVPLDSNRSRIISEAVPFYEMVLHGYVDFAGDCLNMTDDYNTTLLKSIESGAGLYFKWIYSDNSVLKETDFDSLYSVNYKSWIDRATKDYGTVNRVLGPLRGQTIVKHEIVSKKVVRVTYEKGTQILVNYSKENVTVDGQTVNAGSFAVVTGK
ncbi:MAG: hypothetical protein IKS11_06060 [Lachnospiraceae bacterium]|nr:hypothetical protein [Lachnospiraceae bacterium]